MQECFYLQQGEQMELIIRIQGVGETTDRLDVANFLTQIGDDMVCTRGTFRELSYPCRTGEDLHARWTVEA
jgi:hypothetical protein